jgi:putative NIF3 family GTP cyclohydrolase 1 type 2
MTVRLRDVVSFLDATLEVERFRDYAPNGLQVEGSLEVDTVVTGVSANLALFQKAAEIDADLIVVHHGLIWGSGLREVTGAMARRLGFLLSRGISLAAYHLPLDKHARLGNNVGLCDALGLGAEREAFGDVKGVALGMSGSWSAPLSRAEASSPGSAPAVCGGAQPSFVFPLRSRPGAQDRGVLRRRLRSDRGRRAARLRPLPHRRAGRARGRARARIADHPGRRRPPPHRGLRPDAGPRRAGHAFPRPRRTLYRRPFAPSDLEHPVSKPFRVLIADDMSAKAKEVLEPRSKIQVDVKTKLPPEELSSIIGDYQCLVVRSATKVTAEHHRGGDQATAHRPRRHRRRQHRRHRRLAPRHPGRERPERQLGHHRRARHQPAHVAGPADPPGDRLDEGAQVGEERLQGPRAHGQDPRRHRPGQHRPHRRRARPGPRDAVVAYDPFIGADAAARLGVELVPLDELYAQADFITIHTPLTSETEGLVDADAWGR